jgi:hypothetical protein
MADGRPCTVLRQITAYLVGWRQDLKDTDELLEAQREALSHVKRGWGGSLRDFLDQWPAQMNIRVSAGEKAINHSVGYVGCSRLH